MNSTTTAPTLTDFLDNGGNPRDALGDAWETFTEAVFIERLYHSPAEQDRLAAEARALTAEAFASLAVRLGDDPDPDRCQRLACSKAWEADVLDDPTLLERLRPFLTAPEAVSLDAQAITARSPFPLGVETVETRWMCANCGTAHDAGEADAVVIAAREPYVMMPGDLAYCRECITTVYDTLK